MPKLKVFVERENKTHDVEAKTIEEILEKLKINPETIIITRNDELITIDAKIKEKDEIKLLSVISGG